MACEGGCIAGGGQSREYFPIGGEVKNKRKECLFVIDKSCKKRKSYENEDVKRVYDEFLDKPLSENAHKYLHTSYVDRSSDLG